MQAAPPEALADFQPLLNEGHIALAVSGGSDSMALTRLVAAWAYRHHPSLSISVLTVDHGLRPESAGEAARVASWIKELGLPHVVLRWTDARSGRGLQARARAARYGLMAQWCREQGAGMLLTAHTRDDQAETVLMRLARTLSPGSLSGIPRQGSWDGVRLFRPILDAQREALRDHLSALGQPWIEDPSNDDPRFERVRIRQALPALAGQGVTPERLLALAAASARASALAEQAADRWIAASVAEHDAGFCILPARALSGLPDAVALRVLGRVLRHYGGGRHHPEAEELRRLLAWARGEGAARRTLAGAVVGRRAAGLWVTREPSRILGEPFVVPAEGTAIWDGRFRIVAPPGSRVTPGGAGLPDPDEGIPAFARRSYPRVDGPPAAPGKTVITALRLRCS